MSIVIFSLFQLFSTIGLMKPLTIITKRSILDVAAVLDPPLISFLIILLRDKLCVKFIWIQAFRYSIQVFFSKSGRGHIWKIHIFRDYCKGITFITQKRICHVFPTKVCQTRYLFNISGHVNRFDLDVPKLNFDFHKHVSVGSQLLRFILKPVKYDGAFLLKLLMPFYR